MTTQPVTSARFRLTVVAAVAACTLALAGCQSGGTPGGAETTTAVATPSATPTPTPTPSAVYKPADAQGKAQNVPVPVKPALADENSKAGLEAFVGYWFALLNYGYETGDLSAWSALTESGCVFCESLQNGIDESYRSAGWQTGGLMSTPRIGANMDTAAVGQNVTVQVVQTPTGYFKSDGTEAQPSDPAGTSAVVVIASFGGGAWSVDDMHPLK